MNVEALIAKRLAAPKSFKVVMTFANGQTVEHPTETLGQAEVHKAARSQSIGRRVNTGSAVSKMLACEIVAI